MSVVIDSSVLVGLINPYDLWRSQAVALHQALLVTGTEVVYFDCVVTEVISATVRRLHEKNRLTDIDGLFNQLDIYVPPTTITWILPQVPRLYSEAFDLIRFSKGELNFNDALIALACRERGIPAIASFDADFDQIAWLERLARPEDIPPL